MPTKGIDKKKSRGQSHIGSTDDIVRIASETIDDVRNGMETKRANVLLGCLQQVINAKRLDLAATRLASIQNGNGAHRKAITSK